jgi:DNA repair photolyase
MYGFELGVTMSSLNDAFRRKFELRASPPEERTMTLEEASSLGIKTWIFYGPIIPGFNDSASEMDAIAKLAKRTRSTILYDRLNLKPLLRSRLQGTLTPDEFQAVTMANFQDIYLRLTRICKERGVVAKYAF